MPSIQQGLGSSASGVQWVVSGYPLTFGLALVAGGRLGDAFGRRKMYLVALTGFVADQRAGRPRAVADSCWSSPGCCRGWSPGSSPRRTAG